MRITEPDFLVEIEILSTSMACAGDRDRLGHLGPFVLWVILVRVKIVVFG
jgi:hypothetical protein